MGHLINPISFRLGVVRYWNSKWVVSQIKYKYHFLFKSDLIINNFLIRFFMRKLCISLGFVFSHSFFIRTNNIFYCIVYFWDSRSLSTIREDFSNFFSLIRKQRIIQKFMVVYKFLNYSKKFYALNFSSISFALEHLNLKLKEHKLFFIKFFSLIVCNGLFSSFVSILILKIYLYSIFLELLCNMKKLYINFIIKLIFFVKLGYFLMCLRKKLFFLRIYLFKFNRFILNSKLSVNLIYIVLKNFLHRSNGIINKSNVKLILRPLNRISLNSAFLGRYLAIRMRQRYRLTQVLGPVFMDLRKNPFIQGYRINCSGRFTRKEMASYQWFKFGKIPYSTINSFLDYSIVPFILKYSLCSFKVWLNLKRNRVYTSNVFRYIYDDFLFTRRVKFRI